MSKPSKEQLDHALITAEGLRDLNLDEDHLGQCLLYLHMRQQQLEKVLEAAKHYLRGGHDQHDHARLVQAVDATRSETPTGRLRRTPESTFGLE